MTVGRGGNNLAVRLPAEVVDAIRLREGERVEIATLDDTIVIRPAEQRMPLDRLFDAKSAAAWRAEYAGAFDWGRDVGREAIPE